MLINRSCLSCGLVFLDAQPPLSYISNHQKGVLIKNNKYETMMTDTARNPKRAAIIVATLSSFINPFYGIVS